jgi:hypothetical protein
MDSDIRDILSAITRLEDELHALLDKQQEILKYRIEGTRVRFEHGVTQVHERFKTGLITWLVHSQLRNIATAPVIYSLVIPLLILDLFVSAYQYLCFPLYRIPAVRRDTFIIIDRHHLRYVNSIERINCVYCGYASGVLAYAREIAARTEQYWCPIKHARKVIDQHRRYHEYADFGDAESYHATVARLRRQLAEERASGTTQ